MAYFRARVSDGKTEATIEERFTDEARLRETVPKRGWTNILSVEEIPDPAAAAAEAAEQDATAPIPVRPDQVRDAGGWKVLDPAIAAKHPLHRLAGWAMLLAILLALSVIGCALGLVYALILLVIGWYLALIWMAVAIAAIAGGWTGFVTYQLFKLRPGFPFQFTLLSSASILLVVVFMALNGPELGDFISIAISGAWIAYVHMSRRIQVSCRNRVKPDDPFLARLVPAA
jgi:hypothetical protein